mmetsp:Transcript_19124/g.54317  ORF Transcript_19124/g.54317 Transcript_19124/m.54317 type:complete len:204 (-) Transcript_19124:829-1440(-)
MHGSTALAVLRDTTVRVGIRQLLQDDGVGPVHAGIMQRQQTGPLLDLGGPGARQQLRIDRHAQRTLEFARHVEMQRRPILLILREDGLRIRRHQELEHVRRNAVGGGDVDWQPAVAVLSFDYVRLDLHEVSKDIDRRVQQAAHEMERRHVILPQRPDGGRPKVEVGMVPQPTADGVPRIFRNLLAPLLLLVECKSRSRRRLWL